MSLILDTKSQSSKHRGEKMKNLVTSNKIDMLNRLEVLLGKKVRGHADTPTEAINLKDELYNKGEIQTDQQNRNALDNFKR